MANNIPDNDREARRQRARELPAKELFIRGPYSERMYNLGVLIGRIEKEIDGARAGSRFRDPMPISQYHKIDSTIDSALNELQNKLNKIRAEVRGKNPRRANTNSVKQQSNAAAGKTKAAKKKTVSKKKAASKKTTKKKTTSKPASKETTPKVAETKEPLAKAG